MKNVRPKKHLGQHFLKNEHTAQRIAESLTLHGGYDQVVEIGPGMGVLTQFLQQSPDYELKVVEIDSESVTYLLAEGGLSQSQIIPKDFLRLNLQEEFHDPIAIIGNLPYNISSQIFFKILDSPDQVTEVVCMIQKEVAERIAAGPGGKVPGILSILMQAYYEVEYLFKVGPNEFNPPPKVDSAVIALRRNGRKKLPCSKKTFFQVVKQGFNNRRKTLRNALKPMGLPPEFMGQEIFGKRAEQLGVEEFLSLATQIEEIKKVGKID